jgi:hypothetical protein
MPDRRGHRHEAQMRAASGRRGRSVPFTACFLLGSTSLFGRDPMATASTADGVADYQYLSDLETLRQASVGCVHRGAPDRDRDHLGPAAKSRRSARPTPPSRPSTSATATRHGHSRSSAIISPRR